MVDHNKIVDRLMRLANTASIKQEVPIGAVLIDAKQRIVGQGHNQTHAKKDGLAHAELLALRQAQKKIGDWRLDGCTLYVTLEPCLMCLGAMANARVSKVCYILADPLFGSIESKLTKAQLAKIFPKLIIEKLPDDGVVGELMGKFFRGLRQRGKK